MLSKYLLSKRGIQYVNLSREIKNYKTKPIRGRLQDPFAYSTVLRSRSSLASQQKDSDGLWAIRSLGRVDFVSFHTAGSFDPFC